MKTQQSAKAAVDIQVDPLRPMQFLTSTGASGFTPPKTAQEVMYLQAAMTGEFEADDFVAGDKSQGTINFDRPLFDTFNYLLELDCRFNALLRWQCAGLRSVKQNFEVSLLLVQAIFESAEIDTLAIAANPGDNGRVNTTGAAKSLNWAFIRKLQGKTQTSGVNQDVNDVAFLPAQCYSKCSIYRGLGQVGYAVLDTDYVGVYGDTVLKTIDFGATWTPTTQSPFTVLGRNATRVMPIATGGYDHRVIVTGGAMAATYPEVGFSDGTRNTSGDAWTNVTVATGAGHGGVGINDIAMDSVGRVWLAADGGHIYMSEDVGETFTVEENAEETTQDLNAIAFYGTKGYAVGDNNVVLVKLEDSTDWAAFTGPKAAANLLSVEVNYLGFVFVGTNGGELYRSYDGCVTWEQIATNIPAVGSIDRIKKDPRTSYVMYLLHNDAAPDCIAYRSQDGGVTWQAENMTTLVNNGLYGLAVIDPNNLYLGGDIVAGAGFIGKLEPRG